MENETNASGSGRSEPVVPQGRYIKLFMEHKSLANGCSREAHTIPL
jgi:hypothetical protein